MFDRFPFHSKDSFLRKNDPAKKEEKKNPTDYFSYWV